MHGECAGTKPALLTSAEHQRCYWGTLVVSRPGDQRPNALRATDLVAGDADEVDPVVSERPLVLGESLSCIDVKNAGVSIKASAISAIG